MSEEILTRLADRDPNVSGLALGELVERGTEAIPLLLEALGSDQVGVRRLAMEGLGDIGDPSAVEPARAALDDPDGPVRSLAAVALTRMGDPNARDALAATLDDFPDLLHSEMSRSTYELPRLGLPALTVAIPLLGSDDWADRAKGAWVARMVLDEAGDATGSDQLRRILADFEVDGTEDRRGPTTAAATEWLASSGLAGAGAGAGADDGADDGETQ